jgi:hypothetical protein
MRPITPTYSYAENVRPDRFFTSYRGGAMKKLSLRLDALVVQSFTTDPFEPEYGGTTTVDMVETPGCTISPNC